MKLTLNYLKIFNFIKHNKQLPFFITIFIIFLLVCNQSHIFGDDISLHSPDRKYPLPNFSWIGSRVFYGFFSGFLVEKLYLASNFFANIFNCKLDYFQFTNIYFGIFYSINIVLLSYFTTIFFRDNYDDHRLKNFWILFVISIIYSYVWRYHSYTQTFAYLTPFILCLFFINKLFPFSDINNDNNSKNNQKERLHWKNIPFYFLFIYFIAFSIEPILIFTWIYIFLYFLFINNFKLSFHFFSLRGKLLELLLLIFLVLTFISFYFSLYSGRSDHELASSFFNFTKNYFPDITLFTFYKFRESIHPEVISFINYFFLFLVSVFLYLFSKASDQINKPSGFIFFISNLILYVMFLIFLSEISNTNFLKLITHQLPLIFLTLAFFYKFVNLYSVIFFNRMFIFTSFALIFLMVSILVNINIKSRDTFDIVKKGYLDAEQGCLNKNNLIVTNLKLSNHPNEGYPFLPTENSHKWFGNSFSNVFRKYYGCKFSNGPFFVYEKK